MLVFTLVSTLASTWHSCCFSSLGVSLVLRYLLPLQPFSNLSSHPSSAGSQAASPPPAEDQLSPCSSLLALSLPYSHAFTISPVEEASFPYIQRSLPLSSSASASPVGFSPPPHSASFSFALSSIPSSKKPSWIAHLSSLPQICFLTAKFSKEFSTWAPPPHLPLAPQPIVIWFLCLLPLCSGCSPQMPDPSGICCPKPSWLARYTVL